MARRLPDQFFKRVFERAGIDLARASIDRIPKIRELAIEKFREVLLRHADRKGTVTEGEKDEILNEVADELVKQLQRDFHLRR